MDRFAWGASRPEASGDAKRRAGEWSGLRHRVSPGEAGAAYRDFASVWHRGVTGDCGHFIPVAMVGAHDQHYSCAWSTSSQREKTPVQSRTRADGVLVFPDLCVVYDDLAHHRDSRYDYLLFVSADGYQCRHGARRGFN